MLTKKYLLALLTTFQFAFAFYPWFPKWYLERKCIQDHTCIASKRSTEDNSIQKGTANFKLRQRLPKTQEPHLVKVSRQADRLSQKYNRGTPVEPEVNRIDRRSNTWSYETAVPPAQTNSAGIDQDGTDYSYFAEILVGSKSTPLLMLLDTGAGSSWLMGSSCTSPACMSHNTFGPADSDTYEVVPDASFSIAYGTGTVSGMVANDTIAFAGLKLTMSLGIANITSNDFSNFPMDGILGLSQFSSESQPSFCKTLAASKSLKSNIFGVDISRASDGGPNTGEINFGATDTSRYSGSLSYTSVVSNPEADWAIPIDNIGFGGKQSSITGRNGYLDTGTSFIFTPTEDAQAFHALVPGSSVSSDGSTYTVPCTTTTPLTITFSGVTYSISPEDWVGPMTSGVCTSNVYGHPIVNDWLLGDTFLKNVYTVFDIDQNRVGLVAKSQSSVSSTAVIASSTGGPNSLTSTTTTPSTTSAPVTGTTNSVSETNSNEAPTGSSGITASKTGATTSPSVAAVTGSPGLMGHQTSASSGPPAAETTSSSAPTPTPSKTSGAISCATRLSSIAIVLVLLVPLLV